jgi:hypothetical protein
MNLCSLQWACSLLSGDIILLKINSRESSRIESLSLEHKHPKRGPNSPEAPTWRNVVSNRARSMDSDLSSGVYAFCAQLFWGFYKNSFKNGYPSRRCKHRYTIKGTDLHHVVTASSVRCWCIDAVTLSSTMRTGGFELGSSALTSSTLKWLHRIQCGFKQ